MPDDRELELPYTQEEYDRALPHQRRFVDMGREYERKKILALVSLPEFEDDGWFNIADKISSAIREGRHD